VSSGRMIWAGLTSTAEEVDCDGGSDWTPFQAEVAVGRPPRSNWRPAMTRTAGATSVAMRSREVAAADHVVDERRDAACRADLIPCLPP